MNFQNKKVFCIGGKRDLERRFFGFGKWKWKSETSKKDSRDYEVQEKKYSSANN